MTLSTKDTGNRRDNFPERIKDALAKRVNYHCSNPECWRHTSGPSAERGKAVNIGVAAHISAAAPGGPRRNDNLSSQERSSIDNGIWLCQNCAKLVDNDPTRYTSEVLEAWKREAESAASEELAGHPSGLPRGIHSLAAPVILTPFNLPAPPLDFTGRTVEISALRQRLTGNGIVTISAIAGMAGVGKTALALQVAQMLVAEGYFCDAQLYINLHGTETHPLFAATALSALLTAVAGPDPRRPTDEETLAGLWRAATHGRDMLLVLDNAADAAQVRPLLPGSPSCAVLITSRQRFKLPGANLLDLETLARDDARTMLQRIAPRLDDTAADQVTSLCGRLPLAVRIAGNYLALNNDCSVAEYATRMAEEHTRLERLRDPDDPDLDVAAAIALSVAQLDVETRRTWALLSLFPAPFDSAAVSALWLTPRRVRVSTLPEEIVVHIPGDVLEITVVESQDNDEIQDHLRTLRNRSLVSYDEETGRYEQHDLLRLAGFQELDTSLDFKDGDKVQNARHQLALHYLALVHEVRKTRDYCSLDCEWLHLRDALVYAAGQASKDPSLLSRLVRGLADYWSVRGMYREWASWSRLAVDISAETGWLGAEGSHLMSLGHAYFELGEIRQAIECFERARAIARTVGDQEAGGRCLSDLGMACAALGEVEQAVTYLQTALEIIRETGDRNAEGNALGNLGMAHFQQGHTRQAIQYYEQALATARSIGNRRAEGSFLGNLGNAFYCLGYMQEALSYHGQALIIAREIGNRRGEAADLSNIGLVHTAQGNIAQAIECHEQALTIAQEIEDRQGEGSYLGCLGIAYAGYGRIDQAIQYYNRGLEIAVTLGDQRNEAIHLGNLGLAYATVQELQQAIVCYERALSLARKVRDRRGEATHLTNMGQAYTGLGNLSYAQTLWSEALAIFEAIESPNAQKLREWLAKGEGKA